MCGFIFDLFVSFCHQASQANIGEFHRIPHRHGLLPPVLQTRVVRQTFHIAGDKNLGADTGLRDLKDLSCEAAKKLFTFAPCFTQT